MLQTLNEKFNYFTSLSREEILGLNSKISSIKNKIKNIDKIKLKSKNSNEKVLISLIKKINNEYLNFKSVGNKKFSANIKFNNILNFDDSIIYIALSAWHNKEEIFLDGFLNSIYVESYIEKYNNTNSDSEISNEFIEIVNTYVCFDTFVNNFLVDLLKADKTFNIYIDKLFKLKNNLNNKLLDTNFCNLVYSEFLSLFNINNKYNKNNLNYIEFHLNNLSLKDLEILEKEINEFKNSKKNDIEVENIKKIIKEIIDLNNRIKNYITNKLKFDFEATINLNIENLDNILKELDQNYFSNDIEIVNYISFNLLSLKPISKSVYNKLCCKKLKEHFNLILLKDELCDAKIEFNNKAYRSYEKLNSLINKIVDCDNSTVDDLYKLVQKLYKNLKKEI